MKIYNTFPFSIRFQNPKILIIGGYGVGNFGDELILSGIINQLYASYPMAEITVISYDPNETERFHQVSAIHPYQLKLGILLKTNVLIIGGGTIFRKHMTIKAQLIPFVGILMKILNKKTMLIYYSLGIDSKTPAFAKFMLKLSGKYIDIFSVRDKKSLKLVKKMQIKSNVYLVHDPALSLFYKNNDRKNTINKNKLSIGLALRYTETEDIELNNKLINMFSQIIDWLAKEYNAEITFFPFCKHKYKSYEDDTNFAKELYDKIQYKNKFKIFDKPLISFDIVKKFKTMDLIIGMRLHSQILAYANHIPIIGISYAEKCGSFLDSIGELSISMNDLSFSHLKKEIKHKLFRD